jgi:hypothetical protein
MNVGLINLNFNASSKLFHEKLLEIFSFVSTKEKVWKDFFNLIKEALKRLRSRVFFFAIKSKVWLQPPSCKEIIRDWWITRIFYFLGISYEIYVRPNPINHFNKYITCCLQTNLLHWPFILCRKIPTVRAHERYSFKGFRKWYIAFGIAHCLNFVHRPVFTMKFNTTLFYPRS